jgi:undecaprenyl-diphosphatase
MGWLEVFVLSVVQGLTEFLPVSSSAHLVLVPRVFGWVDQGLAFDVAAHLGTLIAVVIYFRRELATLFVDWSRSVAARQAVGESTLAWGIIIATIPACLAGLLFSGLIEEYLRSPLVIAATTIIFGFVLLFADRFALSKDLRNLTLYIALIIGLAQVLSLIPGVSRSGITLSAALLLGCSRVSAARFSFLLSIPIIFLAAAYEGVGLIGQAVQWDKLIAVVALSFVSGYLCIYGFLAIIQRFSMLPFVLYRLALGVVLFVAFW